MTTRLFVVPQEYGGYVTSLLVSGEESPVKCGAVLSPITDFELYGELCLFAVPPTICVLHSLLYVVNKYLCIIIQAQAESIQKGKKTRWRLQIWHLLPLQLGAISVTALYMYVLEMSVFTLSA